MGHEGKLAVPVAGIPGAWIISNQTITPSGRVFVLPASRFWAFQAYETAILAVLSLALAGFSVWWIRSRRLAR